MFNKEKISTVIASVLLTTTMVAEKIETDRAPKPIGPYSQATFIEKNGTLYISGQIPLDIKTGKMVSDINDATHLVMEYMRAILMQAGMTLENVVKTNIYLTDLKNFATVNDIYATYFRNVNPTPARETVQVAALPRGAVIEISMIAVK